MPFPALIFPILMAVAAADEPSITVRGYPWAPFISPMGEPFRGGPAGVAPIARWFARADKNQDGVLTVDELQADADRFFARLDDNHDGQIDPDEMRAYEYEVAPEIQVNSEWRRQRGEISKQPVDEDGHRREDSHDGYRAYGLQGAARYGLLNMPQPVASADADFNRAVTLSEFRLAAAKRFALLDGQGQGRITLPELETRLPTRPKGKRSKPPRKDAPDTRIGSGLPEGS